MMELHEYFYIIKKRFLLIILITLATTLTSAVLSYFVIKPTYKADISVIIGKTESDDNAPRQSYNDIMMYQKMVKTYSQIAQSRTVAEDVKKKLNLDISAGEILSMVSVAPKGDTEFLNLTVKSKDGQLAVNIANQLARSLKEIGISLNNSDNVKLLDEAQLPTRPDSPKPLLNIAIAFFIGLMISVGLVFLLEYLDNTIKTQEDVEKLLSVPVIGIIPYVEDKE